jgi:alpha-L-fucosidase
MNLNLKLSLAAALVFPFVSKALDLPVAPGPFVGTRESLTNYTSPDWFRDAKFGIWAHWGPQSVPMEGDWYAREMYQQGTPQYKHHLETYGHPTTNGWKDVIPLWKAEKWEPEKLMALYKKAGAKYFVSMGTHHDNFFLWNSKLHDWNAVKVGPHRDVVGEWQVAARKNGLPFGVSEHLGASFSWFQDSHKSDKTGPLAGVPYDGANSNYWDLYHFPAEPTDKSTWYTKDSRWQQQWFNEVKELVDNYQPDLLYSDGPVVFGNEVGLSQIANLYNLSAAKNGGKSLAIYNCKETSGGRWVQDYERGVGGGISPDPWQTDTSIGDWFYNRHWKYQPLRWTVHMLVDIVSKNGNLLLNVVQRPDGTLDPEVETLLAEMAEWTAINGEGIYGTRPWSVYGEGPMRARGGAFKEDFKYGAKDIRFTTKGATLYAFVLGLPEDRSVLIKSLATIKGGNQIKRVELLGRDGKLKFKQSAEGLLVKLPAGKLNESALGLRITGSNFTPAPIALSQAIVSPDNQGKLTLTADDATLHGKNLKLEEQGGKSDIGYWDDGNEWVSWQVTDIKPGQYEINVATATLFGGAKFVVEVGEQTLNATPAVTGAWDKFSTTSLGLIEIKKAGKLTVKVRAADPATWKAINLNSVRLLPIVK